MIQVISDYDGYSYTVCPCWVSGDIRLHYCGFYASRYGQRDSWTRVMELEPKPSKHTAWEDLERYVNDLSCKAVKREEMENEKTVSIDD